MISTERFIQELALQGVTLWAEGDALRYRGDKAVLTGAHLAEIKSRKPALLAHLHTEGVYTPLTHGQQALWFVHQQDPASDAYNIPLLFRIHALQFDPARLRHALDLVAERHPMLRTRFVNVDGKPLQQICHHLAPRWEVIDRSAWSGVELMKVVDAHARHPFDVMQGPLLRATLFTGDNTSAAQPPILLLNLHHLVFDHWSIPLLADELCAFYRQPDASALPPLAHAYIDYVYWEMNQLSQEGQTLANYWQQQLVGTADSPLPVLALPTDHPRPAVLHLRGETHEFQLDQDLSQQLRALARAEGVTLYTLLLAAYQVLLYRYTGQERLLVGSPTSASRGQAGFAGVVGYFVNPIVLAADLAGDLTFRTLLDQTRQTVLEGLAHQAYPFPLLVQQLQPARDPSRSPIFQTLFVHQKLPRPQSADTTQNGAEFDLEGIPIPRMEGQFDLVLLMEETEEADAPLLGAFKYHADLFEPPTLARLTAQWQTLLAGIVAAPETPLAHLPLLPDSEQKKLLHEWNATERPFPAHLGIHQLFEAQAQQQPEAKAVVFVEEQLGATHINGHSASDAGSPILADLTYRELNERANRLAHCLRTLGVGPDVLVGLYVERSPEMVIGLLGVMKAGGAYLPLDPAYPSDRLAFMLTDAQVQLVLTQTHLRQTIRTLAPDIETLVLDNDELLVSAMDSKANLANMAMPDGLAYVIYTSGSTGQPKGVQIEHRGLTNLSTAQIRAFGVEEQSRVLQFASFNFDASISEIAMALCAGATLYLAEPGLLLPGPPLSALLEDHAISHVTLTPSTLAMLTPGAYPALQTLIVAGEACPGHLVQQWGRGRRFLNAYGPSENTVCATIMDCTATLDADGYSGGDSTPPIGRPIDNVQVYILDQHKQPVPMGASGELYIGGVGVARGYLNRPELTAERFIEWPVVHTEYADQEQRDSLVSTHHPPRTTHRLYKTGDLARYLLDGNIEFLGRIDHQVKVRGYRVELEELETHLQRHPGVQDAVVVAQGETSERRLLAYWTPTPQPRESSAELRQYMAQILPEYMVPAQFIELATLPLTPSGKVDRQALPAPEATIQAPEAYVAPATALEKELAVIWEAVLQVQPIGIRGNFFEVGGHSLLAVRLLSQIEKKLGERLSLATLLLHPTIEQLAKQFVVNGLSSAETAQLNGVAPATLTPLVPLQTAGVRPPFFCAHPVGGNVLCYRELVQAWGNEQPFYGLQSTHLHADSASSPAAMLTTIEEMAAYYRQAVATVQPQGPYYLGGWSMGGVIAYEMARQWEQEGETVARLVLIESYVPTDAVSQKLVSVDLTNSQPANRNGHGEGYLQHINLPFAFFSDLARLGGQILPLPAETKQESAEEAELGYWLTQTQKLGAISPALKLDDLAQFWQAFRTNYRALASYRPQPYSGSMLLVRGDVYHSDDDAALSSWQALVGGRVKQRWCPGDHYSLIQAPQVQSLAESLCHYFADISQEDPIRKVAVGSAD